MTKKEREKMMEFQKKFNSFTKQSSEHIGRLESTIKQLHQGGFVSDEALIKTLREQGFSNLDVLDMVSLSETEVQDVINQIDDGTYQSIANDLKLWV